MKFDFIIGNPPYQDETIGENKTFAPPIYHLFIDNAYKISDRVELIHPARFLFNAGNTPKQWNQKMLNDQHLKVLFYASDSKTVFPNAYITGGVVITYRDTNIDYGAIRIFTQFEELNSILKKIWDSSSHISISKIAISRTAYRLSEKMHQDYPEAINQLSNGHAYDMSTNIFERLPQIFYVEKPSDGYEYIKIIGREENERVYKFVRRDYINPASNLYKYKIFLGRANGASGALGERPARLITPPFLGFPAEGNTESFISLGAFDTQNEAESLEKYIKTKFARVMLGVLKTTQDITPEKWKYVPLQDFTPASDIDWSKTISEIDQQLYEKYSLDEDEIAFIESHVKEME